MPLHSTASCSPKYYVSLQDYPAPWWVGRYRPRHSRASAHQPNLLRPLLQRTPIVVRLSPTTSPAFRLGSCHPVKVMHPGSRRCLCITHNIHLGAIDLAFFQTVLRQTNWFAFHTPVSYSRYSARTVHPIVYLCNLYTANNPYPQ